MRQVSVTHPVQTIWITVQVPAQVTAVWVSSNSDHVAPNQHPYPYPYPCPYPFQDPGTFTQSDTQIYYVLDLPSFTTTKLIVMLYIWIKTCHYLMLVWFVEGIICYTLLPCWDSIWWILKGLVDKIYLA